MVKPVSISELFNEEPIQWGLCGDPYLWRDMKQQLMNIRCPDSIEKFIEIIEATFQDLTDYPISHQDFIGVEKYSHGGMSSGCVDPKFWREKAIPLLKKRYLKNTNRQYDRYAPADLTVGQPVMFAANSSHVRR